MYAEIKRWGNSAAIRLPSKVLAQAQLDVMSPITIEVENGKIVIAACRRAPLRTRLPFSEAALLAGLDAHTAHADELATITGREAGE